METKRLIPPWLQRAAPHAWRLLAFQASGIIVKFLSYQVIPRQVLDDLFEDSADLPPDVGLLQVFVFGVFVWVYIILQLLSIGRLISIARCLYTDANPDAPAPARDANKAVPWPLGILARPPVCPKCGYDLRVMTTDRCPECGVRFAAPPAETSSDSPQ